MDSSSNMVFEIIQMEVPDQSSGDCGVFMIEFFRMLLIDGKIGNFSGLDATNSRKDIAEILRTQVINDGVELPDLQFE